MVKKTLRDYIFHEYTQSICPQCMKVIPAKIVFIDNQVYINKHCNIHGNMSHLLEEDKRFLLMQELYKKPGNICKIQTKVAKGCPFDCGLCPDHEQHTCIGLIEITNACNLKCPLCYAFSGAGDFLPLKKIEQMMDFYMDSEFGRAEILQISGGEPTLHPQIIDIISSAKSKGFKYVMLNTNGLKFAESEEYAKQFTQFKGGFEIYLQFDSLENDSLIKFRGRDIKKEKLLAIENLVKNEIPITLVTTVARGINDKELGSIVNFGLNTKCIRGINIQPVAFWGRLTKDIVTDDRITLTGVLNNIEKQMNGMIKFTDFVPLPCHPERVAFTYLYKHKDGFIPITREKGVKEFIPLIDNTFTFYPEDILKTIASNKSQFAGCNCFDYIAKLRKMIPAKYWLETTEAKFRHIDENLFRISVTSFVDAYNFDMKSVKKECVHIITPEFKKVPFSMYNMVHRP